MTKMTFSTEWTVKIVENPVIVEKFWLTEHSTIARFYCSIKEILDYELGIFQMIEDI